MRYLPLTPEDRTAMLNTIGAASVDDFYQDVPASARLSGMIEGLPDHKGELAVERHMARLASKNTTASDGPFFVGAGAYKHHVPASVDMIIQSQRCHVRGGCPTRDIAFTVADDDADLAKDLLHSLTQGMDAAEVVVDKNIAKVSAVGVGMVHNPGTAAKLFRALAEHDINIQMIATSEIKVSCVVAESDGVDALKAIHSAFDLAGNETVRVPA